MGSALLAMVIMLAAAALSEQFNPAAASHEPAMFAAAPAVAANTVVSVPAASVPLADDESSFGMARVPERLVLPLAGVVLIGLGGALRATRRDR